MLEFGGEETLEVVLDDKNAEEIGVAAGAENVPGKGGDAEAGDGQRVNTAKRVAPAFGENGPEQDAAAGEDERGGAFGESGEAKKNTEDEGSKGG